MSNRRAFSARSWAANTRRFASSSCTERSATQADYRADSIDQVGADLVVLPPAQAQDTLREHYHRQRERALAGLDAKTAKQKRKTGPTAEQLARLPADLLTADSVGLIHDEAEGLNHYRDFGRLDELFADPALVRDRTRLTQLREYLDDDSVSPLAIRRLAQRHPDRVFRDLLRKPGFSWARDGEDLLVRPSQPAGGVSADGGRPR